MSEIYRITIHGKLLESRDLRKLLAAAVAEKRAMDRKMKVFADSRSSLCGNGILIPVTAPALRKLEQAG